MSIMVGFWGLRDKREREERIALLCRSRFLSSVTPHFPIHCRALRVVTDVRRIPTLTIFPWQHGARSPWPTRAKSNPPESKLTKRGPIWSTRTRLTHQSDPPRPNKAGPSRTQKSLPRIKMRFPILYGTHPSQPKPFMVRFNVLVVQLCYPLLAPQSGAHTIAPHRDPIQPIPSNPIQSHL